MKDTRRFSRRMFVAWVGGASAGFYLFGRLPGTGAPIALAQVPSDTLDPGVFGFETGFALRNDDEQFYTERSENAFHLRAGSRFDAWTSVAITLGYAVPGFLLAVVLVVVFAGGEFFSWFPTQGLVSENWEDLSWPARIADYFWHMTLPIVAMVIGAFASLTMLTKNSILDEIGKQYVITARAKGLSERGVLYGHVFRNAMLIVIAGFPAAFIGVLFTSSLLIEVIFSLDGLGLLGFEATINRDYPVMLGSLFIFSLLGLIANLLGDVTYTLVDPRIDFERRDV